MNTNFNNIIKSHLKWSFLIFILLFFTRCNNKDKRELNIYKTHYNSEAVTLVKGEMLKNKKAEKNFIYNDKFDVNRLIQGTPIEITDSIKDTKVIILESNENCLLADIEKILFVNDNIYIKDRISKILYVFSRGGEFMFKIDKQGRGPGEYISISDFDVNKNNNNIYVYSAGDAKILKYDDHGVFISSSKVNFSFNDIFTLEENDKIFFTWNSLNPHLGSEGFHILRGTNDSITNRIGKVYKNSRDVGVGYPWYSKKSGNEILYMQRASDTIFSYNYKDNKLRVKYVFNFLYEDKSSLFAPGKTLTDLHEKDYNYRGQYINTYLQC